MLALASAKEPVGDLPEGLRRVPGPCSITAARYDDSPVGPYRELAVGEPAHLGARVGLCITTMAVTSADSRLGGRVNWGFPKELGTLVWLDEGRRKARAQGSPVVDNAFVDSYSIGLDDKQETYARMLRDLAPGLSEWAVHPAHGTEEWQAIEPGGWRVRHSDHAFLTSPRAREIIRDEGITVIDYRLLQRAWKS